MGFTDALLNIGVTAMQGAALYMSLHHTTPDATGSNETTAARVPCSWPAPANGDFGVLTNKLFTGGAPNGDVVEVGFWTAASGGTWRGSFPLTGDQKFNGAGEYTLTSLAIPGTSS